MREGFRNEALRAALVAAVSGNRAELETLLVRYGGLPGPVPNFKLATAFGAELANMSGPVERLLTELGGEPAPAESPRAFLPVAAAHGWAERVRGPRDARDVSAAWRALAELAVDVRRPVRQGVLHALREQCLREGVADALADQATQWLEDDDRALAFGASAVVLEVVSDPRVLGVVRDPDRLLAYVTQAIDAVASASRAAQRLDGRRRLLASLTKVSAAIVSQLRASDRGPDWMAAECERATHPDVRAALSQALLELSNVPRGTIDRLRSTLEASAKPLRDPSRVRPGHGRGRKTRPLR